MSHCSGTLSESSNSPAWRLRRCRSENRGRPVKGGGKLGGALRGKTPTHLGLAANQSDEESLLFSSFLLCLTTKVSSFFIRFGVNVLLQNMNIT